jgi:hexosaminidase
MQFIITLGLAIFLSACMTKSEPNNLATLVLDNSKNMSVTYQVTSNTAKLPCNKTMADGECYASKLTLAFTSNLPSKGWEIVFSHLSPIQSHDNDHFTIEHLNGDLHKLTPLKAIEANKTFTINLISSFWSVSKSDVLPNYFFVYNNDQTAIIAATQEVFPEQSALPTLPHAGVFSSEEQVKRNSSDNTELATAALIFKQNQKINNAPISTIEQSTIPFISNSSTNKVTVDLKSGLSVNDSDQEAYNNAWKILTQSNVSLNPKGTPVNINSQSTLPTLNEQGYILSIQADEIDIQAVDHAGVFYALMTLNQLISSDLTLSTGRYEDAPRYTFRGVHLDVARNFRSVKFVKTLIQQMAQLKLNKLHLHLADDEGWRLEITGLDELTSIGGYRCYDPSETQCLMTQLGSGPNKNSNANGYYSIEEYRHILQFAAAHQVEIIPSLDMPGHSRAAIKSMEARYKKLIKAEKNDAAFEYLLSDFEDKTVYSSVQHYNDNTLNPCLGSTYMFVDKVLSNLILQHKLANIPLKRYHIGADETAGAWHNSPVCHDFIAANDEVDSIEELGGYFVGQLINMVQEKGIVAAGWSDGMREVNTNIDTPVQVNVWDALMWQGHEAANTFNQNGWRTILSYPDVLYFDFPYAADPSEPGYYWASRATDSYKVFQFMPDTAEQNSRLWSDRQNTPYKTNTVTPLLPKFEGIQAHLWSEIVRHDTVAQYMYFPRLISYAQKAWFKSPWEDSAINLSDDALISNINSEWRTFSHLLVEKTLPQLTKQGVQFRLPPPGALVIAGKLHMNHLFEGLQLQYQQSDGAWVNYTNAIKANNITFVRAQLTNTQRYSTALPLNH